MNAFHKSCIIWQTNITDIRSTSFDGSCMNSPRAGGWYAIDRRSQFDIPKLSNHDKARLTTWLVDQHRVGVDVPRIDFDLIDQILQTPPLSADKRADRLLMHLGSATGELGHSIEILPLIEPPLDQEEYMMAWSECSARRELMFLLGYLAERDWVSMTPVSGPDRIAVVVGISGHVRISELTTTSVSSSQAFIAMWFDDSMTAAYSEGIEPAVKDAGYGPLRVDRKEHNNKIDDEIIAEIRRSRFLVADFTDSDDKGARGGVYFEAGFALGLNIPVIYSCREDRLNKIHFDTRQYNHIKWTDPADLRRQLANRISRTIGDGPERNK